MTDRNLVLQQISISIDPSIVMASFLEEVSSNKTHSGKITKYKFTSSSLGGLQTSINVYIPPKSTSASKFPVLFYLAGLTCNEDTGFVGTGALQGRVFGNRVSDTIMLFAEFSVLHRAQKGGFLGEAAKHGMRPFYSPSHRSQTVRRPYHHLTCDLDLLRALEHRHRFDLSRYIATRSQSGRRRR